MARPKLPKSMKRQRHQVMLTTDEVNVVKKLAPERGFSAGIRIAIRECIKYRKNKNSYLLSQLRED